LLVLAPGSFGVRLDILVRSVQVNLESLQCQEIAFPQPRKVGNREEADLKGRPSPVPSTAAFPGPQAQAAASHVAGGTLAQGPGPTERQPVDFLGLLPFPAPSADDQPGSTTRAKWPSGISPEVAENLGEVRQIFVSELDQVRRFISCLYIQANDTLDWLHENFRKCMRENIDTLEDARQRVSESVTGLTTGFLAAQEQAANLLERASERHAQELQRRVETLDQIPGQLRKSSDEILAAFRKHATESTETLTKVSTAALRVAEKLQAENFRVGLRTFLAAIAAAAVERHIILRFSSGLFGGIRRALFRLFCGQLPHAWAQTCMGRI
jgi:hypothetical protein